VGAFSGGADGPELPGLEEDEDQESLRFEVPEALAGRRLDAALAHLGGVSRSQVQRWIQAGRVRVDGRVGRASQRVVAGTVLEARPPPVVVTDVLPEDIALAILHEDADLIVVDKPAGMVVHPAPGHHSGTLVNALLHHCGDLTEIGGVRRPGIVHRLDRGTSGVMVAAKNDAAHGALAAQFHDHTIERVYCAIVRALPTRDEGRVDRPIGRHPRDRKRMSVRTRAGRDAVTNWRVVERFRKSGIALLEIRPETGRTHQIRVHLAASGLPILGDPVYGRGSTRRRASRAIRTPPLDRPALHASVLGFRHPTRGERLRFEAPFPEDLEAALAWLRASEEAE
jgi:23S rRNA pseudouridine1911/1915/1917 synthase